MDKIHKPILLAVLCIHLLLFVAPGCNPEGNDVDFKKEVIEEETPYPLGEYYEPGEWGPYEVGVRTVNFIDSTRYMEWGKTERTLVTEIWYPIEAREGKVNSVKDMLGPIPDWAYPLARKFYGDELEDLLMIKTDAIRDADPYIPDYPFPVIFFSHGLSAIRFQNYNLCEHLASHGFVVVAPDHYDNAILTNIDGRIIFFNPATIITSEIQRPRDIAFLVDELKSLTEAEGHFLYQLIDPERFGLTGHSYGGMTSYEAGARVPEISSVAPLNPVMLKDNPESFTKPTLVLVGDNDQIAGNIFDSSARARENYDAHKGKKAFITLLNSGHYSATDACILLPPGLIPDDLTGCSGQMIDQGLANDISNAYLTSFFSITLKQDERYLDFLLENQYPENIEYDVLWEESEGDFFND